MIARILLTLTIFCSCSTIMASNEPAKKTVLITGGLSGLGRAIATEFRDEGWNVWVTSRDPRAREKLEGVKVRTLYMDDEEHMRNLIKEIKVTDKRLDVLINNAAITVLGPAETISPLQAKNIMNINVIAPMILMQESLPLMRAANGGHIINISSTSGIRALPGLGVYAASKMALEGISEAVAAEVAQWNIKVTIIEPGTVNNKWSQNLTQADKRHLFPGYAGFSDKLQSKLNKKSKEVGQSQQDIAKLALQIANNNKPDLRYQTNKKSKDIANEVLVDPSGNKMHSQSLALSKELLSSTH